MVKYTIPEEKEEADDGNAKFTLFLQGGNIRPKSSRRMFGYYTSMETQMS